MFNKSFGIKYFSTGHFVSSKKYTSKSSEAGKLRIKPVTSEAGKLRIKPVTGNVAAKVPCTYMQSRLSVRKPEWLTFVS